jgi:hypothetical protein
MIIGQKPHIPFIPFILSKTAAFRFNDFVNDPTPTTEQPDF